MGMGCRLNSCYVFPFQKQFFHSWKILEYGRNKFLFLLKLLAVILLPHEENLSSTYREKLSWEIESSKANSKNIFFSGSGIQLCLPCLPNPPLYFFFSKTIWIYFLLCVTKSSWPKPTYVHIATHTSQLRPWTNTLTCFINVLYSILLGTDFIKVSNDLLSAKPWSVFSLSHSQKKNLVIL